MPSFVVDTRPRAYEAIVERGAVSALASHIPTRAGKVFVITTTDVWRRHGAKVSQALAGRDHAVLFFPGGEERKRLAEVESLAEQMVASGGDRASIVVTFGGGIVCDVGGFVAASFMRGIPVVQAPTTLLAQVDAGVGGKTGVNLVAGKNLVGAFHQPLVVLVDPDVLDTLPEREYRAGLYEILKTGVIRSERLFQVMADASDKVLAGDPDTVLDIVAQSVEIKAEVVSADEKEGDLRRILNFGHTLGHALEAETAYTRLLHGEAVAFGMRAATHLSHLTGHISAEDSITILNAIDRYGKIPSLDGVAAQSLVARLGQDKKTVKGKVHCVLPVTIGEVKVVADVNERAVLEATDSALRELAAK
ncbi:MAG: 3-dehydroquinate synthase [bacterium]|nr:3-dehydroquinate synthase [bacterium]